MSTNFTELLDALDDELRKVTDEVTIKVGQLDSIKDRGRGIARRAVEAKKNITKSTTGTRGKRKPKGEVQSQPSSAGVTQSAVE